MSGISTAPTLVEVLGEQAERYQDKVAFSFAPDGAEVTSRLTYGELDTTARAIAAGLQARGAVSQRVLVLCRPGLEAIAGYFGCLYAGAVAVPVHEFLLPRFTAIVPNARPAFALAIAESQAKIRHTVDALAADQPMQWCVPDGTAGDADAWVAPNINADTVAMIQYTSGSTTSPRGVVLTHNNLLQNIAAIHGMWRGDDQEVAVWWQPQHHDMGLIGGVLAMLYVGCSTVLMSPTAFIRRPMRWLQAVSRYRATLTAAPNFAYDLCVEQSSAAQRAQLDLSSLSTVWNGAEPIRFETLQRFIAAFAPSGFRPEAFEPVYGLAESTVLVAGGSDSSLPLVRRVDRAALSANRVVDADPDDRNPVELVGCGRPQGGQNVMIVDPETRRRCEADEVGEIWVAGSSVAQGYWGRPEETAATFGAHLAGSGEGPFLRTGDLGFLRDGELFITGRCKDVIIIGGNNYYPNDIEVTAQACDPVLLSGRGAAFSIPSSSGAEQLVVVQEIQRGQGQGTDLARLMETVRAAIHQQHGIQAHTVLLVEKMRIPTTSSGKIQRSKCRQQFLNGELESVAESQLPTPDSRTRRPSPATGPVTITLDI